MNTDLRSSGKRKRANSYIDNADKIGDNKIFDLLGYLNIIDREETNCDKLTEVLSSALKAT